MPEAPVERPPATLRERVEQRRAEVAGPAPSGGAGSREARRPDCRGRGAAGRPDDRGREPRHARPHVRRRGPRPGHRRMRAAARPPRAAQERGRRLAQQAMKRQRTVAIARRRTHRRLMTSDREPATSRAAWTSVSGCTPDDAEDAHGDATQPRLRCGTGYVRAERRRGFVDRCSTADILATDPSASAALVRTVDATELRRGHTLNVIRQLRPAEAAVIVTAWKPLTDDHLSRLLELDVVLDTGNSSLTRGEASTGSPIQRCSRWHPRRQPRRDLQFGDTEWGRTMLKRQDYLLTLLPVSIRHCGSRPTTRVLSGDLVTMHRPDAIGGGTLLSMHDQQRVRGSLW